MNGGYIPRLEVGGICLRHHATLCAFAKARPTWISTRFGLSRGGYGPRRCLQAAFKAPCGWRETHDPKGCACGGGEARFRRIGSGRNPSLPLVFVQRASATGARTCAASRAARCNAKGARSHSSAAGSQTQAKRPNGVSTAYGADPVGSGGPTDCADSLGCGGPMDCGGPMAHGLGFGGPVGCSGLQ